MNAPWLRYDDLMSTPGPGYPGVSSDEPGWWERQLTVADLDDLPEDDLASYEVIDGTLYMAPLPLLGHQHIASQLLGILVAYLHEHPIGKAFTSGTKVVLDEFSSVGPDLVYISNERSDLLQSDGVHGPPDLVVEILSSRPQLDRVIKFRKYEERGIPNYWIIDPEEQLLEAFELRDEAYALTSRVCGNARFASVLFPGLVLDLARLWL